MKKALLLILLLASFSVASAATLPNATTVRKSIQATTESQIRRLVEPLLEKYCRDECKLLTVSVDVDLDVPDTTAPGFDDIPPVSQDTFAPTGAKIKLLIDDKVGSVSRGKLLELIQQYLDTLDYPVTIDSKVVHFPQPVGSEARIADLRDQVGKSFRNTVNDLLHQYCPDQCLFTDFDLKTEVVNGEEADFGPTGEFVQDGDTALRIRNIGGTLLLDDTLSPDERDSILQMIKLKTNSYRNVTLKSRTIHFPRPIPSVSDGRAVVDGTYGVGQGLRSGALQSTNSTDARSLKDTKETRNQSLENRNLTTSEQNSDTNNTTSNQAKQKLESTSDEKDLRQERFERTEKIERVENGSAVQKDLDKFKIYALIFACSILSLLIFIAFASMRSRKAILEGIQSSPLPTLPPLGRTYHGKMGEMAETAGGTGNDAATQFSRRLEIQNLTDELIQTFAQYPRVAKHVFTRVITEDGIEVTAQYLHIFGESIMVELLRDPSLQSDMTELMEYYARSTIEMNDQEKLELLRRLHHRTVSGKLAVMHNRSSNLFDFLAEMDAVQVQEMIRNESLTVKAIILTQCDTQKRAAIFNQTDEETRMRLLTELSRIDYLPRDYVYNVANALKRKRRENPRLNTEALPGSEVLVTLLERTGTGVQRDVMKNLENMSPENARNVMGKLVSIDTLRYLRDGQLLEVVLSLRHDELIQFLKGAPPAIRDAIFAKSPRELVVELEDELEHAPQVSRESYFAVERKILNRMKLMANDGLLNLVETNERMFGEIHGGRIGSAPGGEVVGTITPDGFTDREAG